ncbi:MAG TPA: PIG-L family deacetylase [Acidimicrobiales bacterium]|nr:PIG-L family deacetylase [Acidimicrobiales bacterium]
MANLVAFHAHPDDECLLQSGSLAKAVHDGHRVVVVYATRGEVGEAPDGLLEPGETLVERRMAEAMRSAEALGVHRVAWLGYRDSGMMGTADNDDRRSFWRADVEEAATLVAAILREEGADVLTIYDENGNYGHPDHIQVHRVGSRAAELAGTPHVLEATISRAHVKALIAGAAAAGQSVDDAPDLDDESVIFGVADEAITTIVDVGDFLDRKRAAIAAHASQVQDTGLFLAMPPEAFRAAMGTEFFIRRGVPAGHRDHDVFAGVEPAARR